MSAQLCFLRQDTAGSGLSNNDLPYVIPMSYVYHDGKIFLHSRGKGKKVEYVTRNPRVCFQVDPLEKDRWSSVLVSGTATSLR